LAPRPPLSPLSCQQVVSLSQSSCVSPAYSLLTGRRRWAKSEIIRPRESLILYKPFNTLFQPLATLYGAQAKMLTFLIFLFISKFSSMINIFKVLSGHLNWGARLGSFYQL
jgi:hypothetical protein